MFLLILFIALAGTMADPLQIEMPDRIIYDLDEAETLFEEFVKTYRKEYENKCEKSRRLEIFKDNLRDVNKRNARAEESAVFGITQFMDLTQEEFKFRYTGLLSDRTTNTSHCTKDGEVCVECAPNSFDWRSKNKVTLVKNQGFCGSCWAFSTIGTVESAYAIKHNQLQEFSEQQLVDCDREYNKGCDGGDVTKALKYLSKVGGSMTESSYPYKGKEWQCKFSKSQVIAKVTSCLDVKGTEDELKARLFKHGPVAISVSTTSWYAYKGGIMRLEDCPNELPLRHDVLLVGYGTEKGIPYWIIKNSWGWEWGELGYVRMERGKNVCGFLFGSLSVAVVA